MAQSIPFQGQITEALHRKAQSTNLGGQQYVYLVFPGIMILSGALQGLTFQGGLLLFIAGILLIPGVFFFLNYQFNHVYRATPYFKHPISGEISDQGLSLSSMKGESRFSWQDFTKMKQGKDIILIYQGPRVFNIISKDFFASDADWESTKAILDSNLGKAS